MIREQVTYMSRAQRIEDARRDCIEQLHSSPYVKYKKEKSDTEINTRSIHIKSALLFQFICAIVIFLFIFSSQELGIEYDSFDFAYVKEKIQENSRLEQYEKTFLQYVQKLQIDKEAFLH